MPQFPGTGRAREGARTTVTLPVETPAWAPRAAPLLGMLIALSAPAITRAADAEQSSGLEEIVVTAEKFVSTVQSTPISITALSADQLQQQGINAATDLARDVPGLSQRYASPGLTEFESRGLASNGGAAPTVGFYLDEVPLSPPALSQSGKVVIDPDLYDVNRIEVLRGPQGTLYGSGSMGGTIRIITNQPKLNTFEGSAQAMGSYTDGGHANGSANVMLNLPLGNAFALRVVASDTYRSGWINEVVIDPFPFTNWTKGGILSAPVTGVIPDVNTERLYGGRVTLLYKPSEDLSVTAMAFTQTLETGGYDLIDSPPGAPYENHYEGFPLTEPIIDKADVYSLTVVANLPFAQLTSASSYFERLSIQTQDASESIYATDLNFAPPIPPFAPIPYYEYDPSQQISQEIRLSSIGNGPVQWVGGAFYSHLTSAWNEQSSAPQNTLAPGGVYFQSNNPYHLKQWALFADGTWRFADAWKLAAGVRYYSYQSDVGEKEWGYFGLTPTEPATFQVTEASEHGFNPRVNLSYEPTANLTAYATAARGFRPGGSNIYFPPPSQPPHCAAGTPQTFGPDGVWNYEVGEKARMFDNWLQVNSDFYYIRWTNVQQSVLLLCGYEANVNAGTGHSYGPELEVNAKLTQNFTVSASGTYTDARITQPTPLYQSLLFTANGHYCTNSSSCTTPILNVPRSGGTLALIYSTPLAQDYKLTARIDDTYVGPSYDEAYYFGLQLPSYSLANARLTLARNRWSAMFFVDNFANKIALVSANNTSFQFNVPQVIRYSTVQPRTFGTQVNFSF
ncbi:MAG TPA: TonB-dependent receptor [Steroidobacteraceae bacterium]|nr:TonB-dependent receptor [Steroidobacteraceae bacterium]